ncbi:hypothetical protein MKW92_002277 [Papaver armeniacum]|nr:hypothetical protein MKW92_002277 [Papaver armeniacum]
MLIYLDGRTSSVHVPFSPRARFNFTGLGSLVALSQNGATSNCKYNVSEEKRGES